MKKILNILVIFLIFLIVLMPNISKADEHSDIIEQINNIYSDFNSGNIKAYKSLSVDLIGKAFDYNDDNLVTEIMRILGENTGTEPKLLITSEEEANLYVSLVNKLKSDLDTFPVLANYVLTTIGGDTYNLYLNNMEERSKYAQETDFSEEGENTGDNENNNGNNNGNTGNEDGEIDNIFDLEWDEISEETYAGDGLTTIGEAQELYKKLQAVDYDALSDEDKAKWDSRYEKLTSWMNANYPGSVEITEDKYDKPIYNNPLINQGGTATATEVTPDKIIDDATDFYNDGKNSNVSTINQQNADTALGSIYNVMLAIGITVTVIWGLILAIKLMLASVEQKAEYKKMLLPYLAGCVIIFGSFAIWKIVLEVMNNVL